MSCPCGQSLEYEKCCAPYHKGEEQAETAEILMRSRYSAFSKQNIDYIEKTHNPNKREEFNRDETDSWSKNAVWHGLEILKTEQGGKADEQGTVEFMATYDLDGKTHNHHELSQFNQFDGVWYFSDGQLVQGQYVRGGPKVGRNDPCPCGSGKKYKKCCAK
jgi:SEC-C motif-containing protein